ncbi:MAG: hypothetical protein KDD82_16595, partial [Planctomycetes bacterium]|nr:hypothetical protein [Planctomycetota bacterium]
MGPLHARGSGSKLGGAHGSRARPSHASGSGTQRRVLIGPYEVEHRLSDRGGRARFVVQRPGLSSQCLLHLYATLPPTAQDLLRERLSACSRVTHRALAATLEVGQEGGRIYVVREHVEGTPLSQVLLDDPPSVERALRWTLSAGEALLLLAGSEVDVAKLDLEGVVLDGERVCLLEVGLDLERALGGSSAALVELLASLLHGGPVGAQL